MNPPRKLSLTRPSRSRAAERAEEGTSRLTVDLPPRIHKAIKHRVLEREMTIREYLLELLEKDGIK